MPSAAGNCAKVLTIYPSRRNMPPQTNISDFSQRRTRQSGRQGGGFHHWTFTQTTSSFYLHRRTFSGGSKTTLAECGMSPAFTTSWGHRKGLPQDPSDWSRHPFLQRSGKHPTHNKNSEKLQMLQVFLFVLTKGGRRGMECVQPKMLTKLFPG